MGQPHSCSEHARTHVDRYDGAVGIEPKRTTEPPDTNEPDSAEYDEGPTTVGKLASLFADDDPDVKTDAIPDAASFARANAASTVNRAPMRPEAIVPEPLVSAPTPGSADRIAMAAEDVELPTDKIDPRDLRDTRAAEAIAPSPLPTSEPARDPWNDLEAPHESLRPPPAVPAAPRRRPAVRQPRRTTTELIAIACVIPAVVFALWAILIYRP